MGSIPGFVNIPLDELREHLGELPRERPVVVSCAVGLRGYLASRILTQHGFRDVRNLSGGYTMWRAATAPVPEPRDGEECRCDCAPEHDCRSVAQPGCADASTGCGDSAAVSPEGESAVVEVDACGLMCPGPILQRRAAVHGPNRSPGRQRRPTTRRSSSSAMIWTGRWPRSSSPTERRRRESG